MKDTMRENKIVTQVPEDLSELTGINDRLLSVVPSDISSLLNDIEKDLEEE